MPIAAENSRWSNSGSAANLFEQRVSDPSESGKETVGMHDQNTNSPAKVFESRIQQAI
jgi:hypothetical protein